MTGTIEGADSVTLSGTQIGSYTRSAAQAATSGQSFTVTCNNHNDTYRFVLINIATFDNSGAQNYASIGEIVINGKKAA